MSSPSRSRDQWCGISIYRPDGDTDFHVLMDAAEQIGSSNQEMETWLQAWSAGMQRYREHPARRETAIAFANGMASSAHGSVNMDHVASVAGAHTACRVISDLVQVGLGHRASKTDTSKHRSAWVAHPDFLLVEQATADVIGTPVDQRGTFDDPQMWLDFNPSPGWRHWCHALAFLSDMPLYRANPSQFCERPDADVVDSASYLDARQRSVLEAVALRIVVGDTSERLQGSGYGSFPGRLEAARALLSS